MRVVARLVVVAALSLAITACGAGRAQERLTVSAAASLTDVFESVAAAFEEDNPGVDVVLNLAGSASLREQILGGAPIDVFASADMANMAQVVAAGAAAGEPMVFARNQLQIAVPTGNPGGVTGLEDFADDALFLGLCAEGVPCGDSAREALAKAGVDPAVDTQEPDVRSLLTKIAERELDAGITYVTDVMAAGSAVEGIDLPDESNVATDYPIAVLTGAPDPDLAQRFIEFVRSPRGQALLTEYGFALP
jgi:molybdate transport system substrate-binding protein